MDCLSKHSWSLSNRGFQCGIICQVTLNETVNPLFVAMRKGDNTYSIQGSAEGGKHD